ncbi:DUF6445 family protein [Sphingomonas xanthus]|uniref:Uncharacterized protein n=1 Tax=Sphingomonas xanthus TaxID=2594473 RepID=A0A516IU44_9SPHN|nr:DUF6445 family protein [Sphingomonas xanthus]QDP20428.1 hypothetical protein FMM02_10965 [Sphingomonas xanthus]
MSMTFALNPGAQFQQYEIGPEREPLLLIDGILANPAAVVEYAASDGVYGPAGAAYPGIRRAAPTAYLETIYEAVAPLLRKTFAIPEAQRFRLDSSFSMVTEPPANLRHYQRVPHIDRTGPYDLAMVHYLCGPEFGGTHFFCHRSTGFQRISIDREAHFNEALNQEINQQILPAGFPDDEHPLFERVATVEATFDRLAIYRASILHSPAITPFAQYSADPRQGRLTMTSFLFAL